MSAPSDAPPQACPACGVAVDVGDAQPLTPVVCPACGEKFRAQSSFDNFLLVETLGIGGMGAVYKARDTRLDRFVALKLLRKELSADPVEAASLEQEARLTAAVNHPNVVQVYSSGHANDQIYLVMELVDHGSLDDRMAQHAQLPEAEVLRAGIEVARGLQAAHEKGLIHRDVKPANILFAASGTAKIGDFGLAVAAGQKAEAAQEIWGTPYYVAPERLNNAPEDFRSDIYSLGATLFHALAGRPPIEGETTSASELRRLKSTPPDIRAFTPDVSRETARLIHKMLAPDPAQRFASYADLIAQMEHAASGDGAPQGGGKSRGLLIGAVVVLALIAALGAGYFFLKQKQAPAVTTASSPSASSSAAPSATGAPDPNAAQLRQEEERARDAQKLAEEAAAREAAEEKARAAEQQRLVEAESPAWEKALAEARAKIAVYDFAGALAAINTANVSATSLQEAQAAERKKIGWLIDWKGKLLADLNAKRFTAAVQVGNTTYTGAAKADASRITFLIPPYGTAAVDWTKIPASALLTISTSLIKPNLPDAPERRWLAAVFAAETGQAEKARELAEAAAKARPAYQEQLNLLVPTKNP